MRVDRKKARLAMARACMTNSDIAKTAGLPQQTVKNVLYGRRVKPCTLGKVAKSLGVDVTEIMEIEVSEG